MLRFSLSRIPARWILPIAIMLTCLPSACTSIPVSDRQAVRQEINDRSDQVIETLGAENPELKQSLALAEGYFVGRISGAKIPVFGAASGLGVLHDNRDETRTYMSIQRFDVGVGLGAGTNQVLVVFRDRQVLEQFRSGVSKPGLGAESGVGSRSALATSANNDKVEVYGLSEAGAIVTVSARVVRLSVNSDLTDTGVSDLSIPNIGSKEVDRQGSDAPRKWDRKLPFMAQRVIDLGYDLPLPYGIGLTYAKVDQEMLLDSLQVGINGRDKVPFDWVSFENASAESESAQLKLDGWLLPFMNVFGLLGKVKGKAPLDVLLDGNGILDRLSIDCSSPPPDPLCPILQGRTITLPITAPFSGTTYGIGTVLAGGWNNWFVSLPMSFTYADMDGTDTEGVAITVTPRFGRLFNLGNAGNLALFAGGNYLSAELTVTGTVSDPGNNFTIDYTVEQKNKDAWNALIGGNWDIDKHWSISAEYNGFVGSREAFISSLIYRF